jgi:hypothetical protein
MSGTLAYIGMGCGDVGDVWRWRCGGVGDVGT